MRSACPFPFWGAGACVSFHRCYARCQPSEFQIVDSQNLPQVSALCDNEVQEFFEKRATDLLRDLPLLAACAADITSPACSTVPLNAAAVRAWGFVVVCALGGMVPFYDEVSHAWDILLFMFQVAG